MLATTAVALRLPPKRWLAVLPLICLVTLGLLATFSRSAWLGFGCGALVLAATAAAQRSERRTALRRLLVVGLVIGASTVLFAAAFPGSLRVRMGWQDTGVELPGSAAALAMQERDQYADVALRLTREQPLLGVGLGAFPLASLRLFQGSPPSHARRRSRVARRRLPG